jgi:SHS family lactate transporter-like MFS transporter
MTGYNSCSHGSQDFYPTYLKDQVGMNATDTTIITVVGQVGALLGGCTVGYISTFFGRRLTMLVVCVIGGALIPAYTMVRSMSLVASVFFEQFCVGGVWGPMPIHLLELSPIALRTVMVGLTYQLGNLGSSASATIQSIIGERFPLPPGAHGKKRFDYGKVIAIFMGAVWAFMLFFLFWGPEMSQEERDEEAEDSMRLEQLRAEGVSLAEIGQQRFLGKGVDGAVVDRGIEQQDSEKAETAHVE